MRSTRSEPTASGYRTSPGPPGRMSSQPQSVLTSTPTRTVQAFLDAFARHDIDAAIEVADPQVSVTVHPLGLHETGADALRQVLADLVRGFPDLAISISRVITTGDVVTALFKAEGTQAADYAGAINQEKHVDIDQAENAGLDPQMLVVAGGSAQAAEDIIRVRRKAHGVADWIHSPTCRVTIVLRPAGLYATTGADAPQPPERPDPPASAGAPAEPAGERAIAVREALFDVIDPDLGVNIVDLGFVRAVTVQGPTAVITMTLTSAACPLTGVMEDQIRAGLTPLGGIEGFRVDWQWIPAWRPADITASGREQLRAIGFTI